MKVPLDPQAISCRFGSMTRICWAASRAFRPYSRACSMSWRLDRVNVAGAIRLAKQLGPGKTIVTILCDFGNRYQSKLFNPDFMRSKNSPVPEWLEKRTEIEVPFEKV